MSATPGPWRQSNNELGYGEYDILADGGDWAPNLGIATVVDPRFSDPSMGTFALDRDVCNANARLIAAAPQLLEELKWISERLPELVSHFEKRGFLGSALALREYTERANAAIAAAEGGR